MKICIPEGIILLHYQGRMIYIIKVYLPEMLQQAGAGVVRIQEFLHEVTRIDGKIDMIEPRRRNLQAFFLDIVAQGQK